MARFNGPGGLLDLGNNFLYVKNSTAGGISDATLRSYLLAGYHPDASGIGDWLGAEGITSADAIASAAGDGRISMGYVDGAYANDPLVGGPIPGQEGLSTDEILVRPALNGDYNLDGKVDDTDVAIFSALGQYNQPTDKFGWFGGDLNHDGKVDEADSLIFSGARNFNSGQVY